MFSAVDIIIPTHLIGFDNSLNDDSSHHESN